MKQSQVQEAAEKIARGWYTKQADLADRKELRDYIAAILTEYAEREPTGFIDPEPQKGEYGEPWSHRLMEIMHFLNTGDGAERSFNDDALFMVEVIALLKARYEEKAATVALLKGTIAADDARLLAATERLGEMPSGCDTADYLADIILGQKERLEKARGLLQRVVGLGGLRSATIVDIGDYLKEADNG